MPNIRTDTRYYAMMRAAEVQLIEWALTECAGDTGAVARLMGVHRSFIYRRMHALGIADKWVEARGDTGKAKKPKKTE